MEMMAMGMDSLEAAMSFGSVVVDQIGSLVQNGQPGQEVEVSCDICKCTW